MNTINPDILPSIQPPNVDHIWRRGDYTAFYQSIDTGFLDIAVRFWDNHGALMAHVGTAVHRVIDGEEQDMIMSVILHKDGWLTNISQEGKIIQGYIPLNTLYLLLNPRCLSHWTLVDRESAMENQKVMPTDITREKLAANIGIKISPLEVSARFDKLKNYMDKLQGVYMDISHP